MRSTAALIVLLMFSFTLGAEEIGHECGFALVRLRKPLEYYRDTYGHSGWGTIKLCSLIEEQRNRGQDSAGIAVMQFDVPAGEAYLHRMRNADQNAVDGLLTSVFSKLQDDHSSVIGQACLGHVRYGTHSANSLSCCQPYLCKNSVASKTFALAGNFNMSNAKELCQQLVNYGLAPTSESDTQVILEMISYCLKQEHLKLAKTFKSLSGKELADRIAQELCIESVLSQASASWDGGYVFAGILGNGQAFVCRDPAGIRPGFFYVNDEVIAAASERTALMNSFNINHDQIQEIKPGHVLVILKDGSYYQSQFTQLLPERQCSFERIYFSRSNDPAIYQERKDLGKNLAERVLASIGDDIDNAIFTYVPNSSEVAFIGLVEELNHLLNDQAKPAVHVEKLVHKNQRLRTFITNDRQRNNLVAHLYSMTKDLVKPTDTLVVVDDSIVRGTTLRESIIRELVSLNPKRIIFVSSAPPVMYPDCYGIDMSQIGRFIAFEAAVSLLREQDKESVLESINAQCIAQKDSSPNQVINHVQKLYEQFTLEEISAKIAQMIHPGKTMGWSGTIEVIYQTIDGLHAAMPNYSGDWYFTGNYPTAGGFKVLNTSFMQWYKGCDKRAY